MFIILEYIYNYDKISLILFLRRPIEDMCGELLPPSLLSIVFLFLFFVFIFFSFQIMPTSKIGFQEKIVQLHLVRGFHT